MRSVVVVGVPGLRWDDISSRSTPELWRLAGAGSLGALSIRAALPRTCPADGWVTLGAGNRARGPTSRGSASCPPIMDGYDVEGIRQDNDRLDFDARLGALETALGAAGRCVTAIGPGARLAAPTARPFPPEAATPTVYGRCPLTLVDARTDTDVGAADRMRPTGSLLLVAGLSEIGAGRPRLHVAIAVGPGYGRRELVSASTRRAPYVQLIDVAPTVLSALGVAQPAAVVGQSWRGSGAPITNLPDTVGHLVDLDRAAAAMARFTQPFFSILVAGQALLYLLAYLAIRTFRGRRDRHRVLRATRVVALGAAGALAGTFLANLVPWWRSSSPLGALLAAVAVADVLLVGVALAGPWRRTLLGPAAAVAGLLAVVLAGDLASGARLQMSSLAGYSPLVAGRFAGIGNVAFGVFGTATLVFAAALAAGRPRRAAAGIVAVLGVLAVVIDGAPMLGSDFGGVLALVPAYAVLGMLMTGTSLSLARLAAAGLAGVGVVTSFALLDYARPVADQTHLGRFVGQLLHGGAVTVVRRKAEANLHLLTHSVLTLLVPLAVLFVAGVLLRPTGGLRLAFERAPALRAGLLSVLVMGVVGFAVNDSGVAVPALAMTVAIPLAIAVSLSALLSAARGAPDESTDDRC